MAKFNRQVVGSFLKSKDDTKPPYLKIKEAVSFQANDIIRVENKAFQLKSLNDAVASGKLPEEIAVKARERIEKIPPFVLGELIRLTVNE